MCKGDTTDIDSPRSRCLQDLRSDTLGTSVFRILSVRCSAYVSPTGSICLFDAGTLCSLYSLVSRAPLHGQPVSFLIVHAGPSGFRVRHHVRTRRTDFRSAGRHAFALRFWAVPAAEPTLECSAPSLEEYTREHQAYLSAEAHPASSCLGLPRPYGNQEWPCRHQRQTPQGTSLVVGFNRG